MKAPLVPSLDDPDPLLEVRIRLIVEWWHDLHESGDSGAATWEELDRIEQEVTECLDRRSLDVNRAESLTAYAMLLIAGCSDL